MKALVRDKDVSRLWHPDADLLILEIGNNITARVAVGEAAYQLSSGEMVTL